MAGVFFFARGQNGGTGTREVRKNSLFVFVGRGVGGGRRGWIGLVFGLAQGFGVDFGRLTSFPFYSMVPSLCHWQMQRARLL